MKIDRNHELEDRKLKMIKSIKDNYRHVEGSIAEQLYMRHDLHGTTVGSEREDIWRQLFEMIIPKKFVIEQSVFIIDSYGQVSREVDLAIMDEMYTPYIFRYGKIKFVPIEAVAVVVECKSKTICKDSIFEWFNEIEKLKTCSESIARIFNGISSGPLPSQKSTRPIRVLCAVKDSMEKEIVDKFDFTLLAASKNSIEIKTNRNRNLNDWYFDLNFYREQYDESIELKIPPQLNETTLDDYHIHADDGDSTSLLTFNFQLNQLLMLINNPILFPHMAYVNMFNGGGNEST